MSGGAVDLNAVLRDYLREALDDDARAAAGAFRPSMWSLAMLEEGLAETRDALAHRDPRNVQAIVTRLAERHGVPPDARDRLAIGVLEADLHIYQKLMRRAKGEDASVFTMPEEDASKVQPTAPKAAPDGATPKPPPQAAKPQPEAPKPSASALVEPFFKVRRERDKATFQVIGQERGTVRRFTEACGDRPPSSYTRGDITGFLNTLRCLPNTYGRSKKDKDRSLADLIAEAETKGAERLTDKTVKRHLSALSQFFKFAVDEGHLSNAARVELVEDHRFREQRNARGQRDAWTSEELTKLFASPVWTGCHPIRRAVSGPTVIRDARFWLPILALFHGARLEEFADLYRRDLRCEEGMWCVDLIETEETEDKKGRRLKTVNAHRTIPLHPELIRLGFIGYVRRMAPNPDDPLFPDLEPQGADKKRGPRITRWFVEYRRAVKVYRAGVAMHAFRHTAITRLTDGFNDWQQKRHRDYIMGHGGGEGLTEGDQRYDKGAGLRALHATLARLQYPEVNLSHLYLEAADDQG